MVRGVELRARRTIIVTSASFDSSGVEVPSSWFVLPADALVIAAA